jgi:Domain of unknown function (DUF4153)
MEIRDDDRPINAVHAGPALGGLRLAIGFAQGIAAWLLLRLAPDTVNYIARAAGSSPLPLVWSERHPLPFAAMALATAVIPVIAMVEAGRMRRRTLMAYLALASVMVAALAAYDLWRDPMQSMGAYSGVRVWPSFQLCLCTAMGLFIVNQLLEHRAGGHRLFSAYAEHFEDSWMRGFQLSVALIFTLLVWGILELGAGLFELIHLSGFRTMIGHNWFRCPALAMAFAAAVHLTDVRPQLLRGVRNVGLTLLSWLLPLIVALSVAFLAALVFVGLKPLWNTRHAASILLWACAITLFLLNAAYKDGEPSNLPPAILRWAARIAAPVMLAFAAIAAYAILLRVHQHGWTPERVLSSAVTFMAAAYGLGYTRAALRGGPWFALLQYVNVSASLAIVAILLLLLTPLADPDRIAVSSQLRRLAAGEVSPAKFDYEFLRFDSGRFGARALQRVASGTDPAASSRATLMLTTQQRSFTDLQEPDPATTEPAFSHASVYPLGAQLPKDFESWAGSQRHDPPNSSFNPDCLRNGATCDIFVVPYGHEVALLVHSYRTGSDAHRSYNPLTPGRLFQRGHDGEWVETGTFSGMNCPSVIAALRAGKFTTAASEHDDLMVDGTRLRFMAPWRTDTTCAGEPRAAQPPKAGPRDPQAPLQMGPAFGSQP